MTAVIRHMVVVRTPGTNNKPMIRISNELLANAGFNIGTQIEITYERGNITIKKIK
jgi:hypothetical protein